MINTTLAKITRRENGRARPFRIISESGTPENLAAYVLAESYIEIKDPSDLSLTTTLFGSANEISFSSPNVIWTPTDRQVALLIKQTYVCFVHLVNTGASPPLHTISRHKLLLSGSLITVASFPSTNPNNFPSTTITNPIGGYVGYNDIVSTGDYHVDSVSEMNSAITSAQSGQTIFVSDDFDATGSQWTIPANVQLRGNRGLNGLEGPEVTSFTFHTGSPNTGEGTHVFENGGANVRISGIRMRGPEPEVSNATYPLDTDTALAIRDTFGQIEIDNCLLEHWFKWAVMLWTNEYSLVHNNYIRYTRRAGFGYPVWVSGSSLAEDGDIANTSHIYENVFEEGRHEIGSGSQKGSSWTASTNLIVDHDHGLRSFDRHRSTTGAGWWLEIKDTVKYKNSTSPFFDFGSTGLVSEPGLGASVHDCYWEDTNPNSAISSWTRSVSNFTESGNIGSGAWRPDYQPTATISSDVTEGTSPLAVNFTATGADPKGFGIDRFYWYTDNLRSSNASPTGSFSKTFTEEGPHTVSVRSGNVNGLVSSCRSKTIWVNPISEPVLHNKLSDYWDMDELEGNSRIGGHRGGVFEETAAVADGTMTGVGACAVFVPPRGMLLRELDPVNEGIILYEDDMTICVWVEPTNLALGNNASLIDFPGYFINTQINGSCRYAGVGGVLDTHTVGKYPFVDNTPVFIRLNIDRSGKVTLYANEVFQGDVDAKFLEHYESVYNTQAFLRLANRLNIDFTGKMCRLGIWKKLLDSDMGSFLFNDGNGRAYSELASYVPP